MQIDIIAKLYRENPHLLYFERNPVLERKILKHQSILSLETKPSTFFAYLAGFIDGEGTINVSQQKGTNQYHIGLSISQSNYEFMKNLFDEIGFCGCINRRPNYYYNTVGYSIQYQSEIAYLILKKCLPFFRRKRNNALLAIYVYELLESTRDKQRRFTKDTFILFKLKYFIAKSKYLNVVSYHPIIKQKENTPATFEDFRKLINSGVHKREALFQLRTTTSNIMLSALKQYKSKEEAKSNRKELKKLIGCSDSIFYDRLNSLW